jgi:hypothetical protein
MDLLKEVMSVRQIAGEPRRRWLTFAQLDLIVWCDAAGAPAAFQLCYDKPHSERAITWTPEIGFLHTAVDDGEGLAPRYKGTPILTASERVDAERVRALFAAASRDLPRDVVDFVTGKLRERPA